MKKNNKLFMSLALILILFILLSALFTGCLTIQNRARNSSGGMSPLSDFTLDDIEGNSVTLSSLKGSVIVLNFWATWCPPCKAEIPDFIEIYDRYRDKNVHFLGISSEDKDLLIDFARTYAINYQVLVDSSGEVFKAYNVSSIPTTFIINPDGEIVSQQVGMMSKSQLENAISEALK